MWHKIRLLFAVVVVSVNSAGELCFSSVGTEGSSEGNHFWIETLQPRGGNELGVLFQSVLGQDSISG